MDMLRKELRLGVHPTSWLFLILSVMLLIPNYPYYVVFFYTTLGIFFTCLTGRENNDVFYSLLLPVGKRDVVKARITLVALLELAQMAVAIPFAVLRQRLIAAPNAAGMDANIALFGLVFIMFGLFNLVFFGVYYKNVQKVGRAFVCSCAVMLVYIAAAECCAFALPFFRNTLDTAAGVGLGAKLAVLAAGAVIYAALTLIALIRAKRNFEKQDI